MIVIVMLGYLAVQGRKIHPKKNGERKLELNLVSKLPAEKYSRLGLNMVAVRDIAKPQVFHIDIKLRYLHKRHYVFEMKNARLSA